jgi:hypothetical protein
MAKAQWEADAKDRLITFLREEYGYSYEATREDVISTGRNYDYELSTQEANLPSSRLKSFVSSVNFRI